MLRQHGDGVEVSYRKPNVEGGSAPRARAASLSLSMLAVLLSAEV